MLCKCYWIVTYCACYSVLFRGGGRFYPDTVYIRTYNLVAVLLYITQSQQPLINIGHKHLVSVPVTL